MGQSVGKSAGSAALRVSSVGENQWTPATDGRSWRTERGLCSSAQRNRCPDPDAPSDPECSMKQGRRSEQPALSVPQRRDSRGWALADGTFVGLLSLNGFRCCQWDFMLGLFRFLNERTPTISIGLTFRSISHREKGGLIGTEDQIEDLVDLERNSTRRSNALQRL